MTAGSEPERLAVQDQIRGFIVKKPLTLGVACCTFTIGTRVHTTVCTHFSTGPLRPGNQAGVPVKVDSVGYVRFVTT